MEGHNRQLRTALAVGFATLAFAVLGSAQVGRQPAAHGRARAYNPAPGWDRTRTLACIYLGEFTPAGTPNRIEVKENAPGSKGGMSEIDFINDWPASPKTLLVYPEGYSYLGMSMMGPDILLTSWSAASVGVIQAFHLVPGGAKLVLERSGWATVEQWDTTLLISQSEEGPTGAYHYTSTQILQWNGKSYVAVATVPYDHRLEALAKIEHEVKNK